MKNLIRAFILMTIIEVSSSATIQFEYLGIGESTDAVGNPVFVVAGIPEIGEFSFDYAGSILGTADLVSFSFSTFFFAENQFGFPVNGIATFDLDDLVSFSAGSPGGSSVEDLRFVTEKRLVSTDPFAPYDLIVRFTAGEDDLGSLQEISDALIPIHQGSILIIPEPQVALLIALLTPFVIWNRQRSI